MNNIEKRIRIVTGHYGSGKTEFSVNYALELAKTGKKIALVDLDIVNPYFRSREKSDILEEKGVRVVSSMLAKANIDIPALSPEIFTILQDKRYEAVLDMGGDKIGARALARFHVYLDVEPYDMFIVVNANRPQTATVEGVCDYIADIEASAGQKITALVNNTHLCGDTSIEDILKGNALCVEVGKKLGLPIAYNVIPKHLLPALENDILGEIFPIDIVMKKPWE